MCVFPCVHIKIYIYVDVCMHTCVSANAFSLFHLICLFSGQAHLLAGRAAAHIYNICFHIFIYTCVCPCVHIDIKISICIHTDTCIC